MLTSGKSMQQVRDDETEVAHDAVPTSHHCVRGHLVDCQHWPRHAHALRCRSAAGRTGLWQVLHPWNYPDNLLPSDLLLPRDRVTYSARCTRPGGVVVVAVVVRQHQQRQQCQQWQQQYQQQYQQQCDSMPSAQLYSAMVRFCRTFNSNSKREILETRDVSRGC
jgi:hypothetical protein